VLASKLLHDFVPVVVREHSLGIQLDLDSLNRNLHFRDERVVIELRVTSKRRPMAPTAGSSKSISIHLSDRVGVFRLMFQVTSLLLNATLSGSYTADVYASPSRDW